MRLLAVTAVLVLSLFTGAGGIVLAAAPSTLNHQEATPVPGMCDPVAATPGTPVASASMQVSATKLAGVGEEQVLYCTVVRPGGEVESHEHFGSFLFYVQSGTVSFTVDEGIMWAHCEAACISGGPAGSEGEETLLPGTTVTLEAGDWVQQDGTTTHSFRNDGQYDAVMLVAATNSPQTGDGGCMGAC